MLLSNNRREAKPNPLRVIIQERPFVNGHHHLYLEPTWPCAIILVPGLVGVTPIVAIFNQQELSCSTLESIPPTHHTAALIICPIDSRSS